MSFKGFIVGLNVVGQCRQYRVSLWTCRPFLFIVMGVVNIAGMIGTAVAAQRFSDDPEVIIISVSVMAAFLFAIGNAVVSSFQRLADASRIKSEFVSIVSHQLRSPLSAIKWQLELMVENMKNAPQSEEQVTIGTIREQNERMIALVNDLLEVNRIDDDRLILRPTVIALSKFIEEIANEYTPLAAKSSIELTCMGADGEMNVFADEDKLRWVTENLLDNAIRYTKSGGRINMRISKTKNNEGKVETEDTGVGIPLADQNKIFNKFFRADNALRLRAQGTGLGLFLVKSLTRAMGGKVGFESSEDKGSTFWFSFPLVKKEAMNPKNNH